MMEWIDVNERLPERNKDVLLKYGYHPHSDASKPLHKVRIPFIGYLNDKDEWRATVPTFVTEETCYPVPRVVHAWTPLPEGTGFNMDQVR